MSSGPLCSDELEYLGISCSVHICQLPPTPWLCYQEQRDPAGSRGCRPGRGHRGCGALGAAG